MTKSEKKTIEQIMEFLTDEQKEAFMSARKKAAEENANKFEATMDTFERGGRINYVCKMSGTNEEGKRFREFSRGRRKLEILLSSPDVARKAAEADMFPCGCTKLQTMRILDNAEKVRAILNAMPKDEEKGDDIES